MNCEHCNSSEKSIWRSRWSEDVACLDKQFVQNFGGMPLRKWPHQRKILSTDTKEVGFVMRGIELAQAWFTSVL
jgi:hypothetical protein